MKFIPALVVTFVALAAGSVAMPLLPAAEGVLKDQPQRTSAYYLNIILGEDSTSIFGNGERTLPSSSPLLAVTDKHLSETSVLDKDLNNDGKYDGMADSIGVLGLGLVAVLSLVFILQPVIDDRLLIALSEPRELSSVWLGVLEPPG